MGQATKNVIFDVHGKIYNSAFPFHKCIIINLINPRVTPALE